jgi:nicotinamidase-related amidase
LRAGQPRHDWPEDARASCRQADRPTRLAFYLQPPHRRRRWHGSGRPPGRGETHETALGELRLDRCPQLPRISFSPFFDEATRAAIAATGRRHLVIAGFATEVVVLNAVRDALAAGYQVLAPVDACGGMSSRTEDAAFRQIEAAGGVTTSVVTLVTSMVPDVGTDLGRQVLEILQEFRLA